MYDWGLCRCTGSQVGDGIHSFSYSSSSLSSAFSLGGVGSLFLGIFTGGIREETLFCNCWCFLIDLFGHKVGTMGLVLMGLFLRIGVNGDLSVIPPKWPRTVDSWLTVPSLLITILLVILYGDTMSRNFTVVSDFFFGYVGPG